MQLASSPPQSVESGTGLRVEYAERGKEYHILFIFSLFCEHVDLAHVRIHAILQGLLTSGIRYSYSCGCVSGIRENVFNM